MPLAPPRLSTITDTANTSVSFFARCLAEMSVGPPAANGTTIRIGIFGTHCACACQGPRLAQSTTIEIKRCILFSVLNFPAVRPEVSKGERIFPADQLCVLLYISTNGFNRRACLVP